MVAVMEHGVEELIAELGARLHVPPYELEESRAHARTRPGGPRLERSFVAPYHMLALGHVFKAR